MIATVFKGTNCYLLNEEPEWGAGAPVDQFTMFRDSTAGLTKHEARRPYQESMLVGSKYKAVVSARTLGRSIRALQGALRALNTQPVIMPYWPGIWAWGDRANAPIKGGLMIAWQAGWTAFGIYALGDAEPVPGSGAWDYFAPALMGFIDTEKAQSSVLRRDAVSFEVEFTESSVAAYALAPKQYALVSGPTPTGYASAPSVLPWMPDVEGLKERTSVSVKREQVGFTRTQFQTFYPQLAERSQQSTGTLAVGAQGLDPAMALDFFLRVMGPGQVFWAPSAVVATRLTANAGSAATALSVDDTSALVDGDYLLAFDLVTGVQATVQVNSLAGGPVMNVVTAAGVALSAGTLFFPLCLARLDAPKFKVSWMRPGAATVELNWTEVPVEGLPLPTGETLGVTIGQLASRKILFEFSRDLGNGTVIFYRFTNAEADVTWNTHTWTSGDFGVGDIGQPLNVAESKVQLESFVFSGNPLVDELTMQSEAPLWLVIRTGDYDPGSGTLSNVAVIFTGDVAQPGRTGNKVKAQCRFGSSIFETMLPRLVRGVSCAHLGGSNNDGSFLISAGCTLVKADWKFTGVVAGPVSGAYPFSLLLNTLTGVGTKAAAALSGGGVFANWFGPSGWVEWVPGGVAANMQRRSVVGSTAPVAGAITLTLHRYFNGLPNIGDMVAFYPGCDGQYSTCKAYDGGNNPTGKFNNGVNFGGEPFTPAANPSTVGAATLNVSGAKK